MERLLPYFYRIPHALLPGLLGSRKTPVYPFLARIIPARILPRMVRPS
jgi:hypothetical protein